MMDPSRPQSSGSQSSLSSSLFQVFLRLRPPLHPVQQQNFSTAVSERYLTVESPSPASPGREIVPTDGQPILAQCPSSSDGPETGTELHPPLQQLPPTHITVHPPNESRKRAVEKFAFTRVFEESAEQIDVFRGVGVAGVVEGVIGAGVPGGLGRDGVLATLGVTGSGKSHTILGSKSERGILQMSLDLLYRSLDSRIVHPSQSPSLVASLCATDPSEAQIFSAQTFLENVYGYEAMAGPNWSRATTPMSTMTTVGKTSSMSNPSLPSGQKDFASIMVPERQGNILDPDTSATRTMQVMNKNVPPLMEDSKQETLHPLPSQSSSWNPFPPLVPRMMSVKSRLAKLRSPQRKQDTPNVTVFPVSMLPAPRKRFPQRLDLQSHPQVPDISNITVPVAEKTEYTILISMYEVYNDRIFDLLSTPTNAKDLRRRHLLFKSTERSPDRKVVAGLRKVVCGNYEEALMILETGLHERRVAGTGSNSVSSRSHGFFVVDVKRRTRGGMSSAWNGTTLTIVDLAGSERARNAKTAGATLAEAGKINESLMYLGQCLQMQSDQCHDGSKPTLVPFRQCKLTELLFSNYFTHNQASTHRNPQKAIMIVTADPLGDFNATSQILRYSALAREVTVPRIPSVSSTILAGINANSDGSSQRSASAASQCSPRTAEEHSMVDIAFSEIARLNEEIEILSVRLVEEEQRRHEAEEGWQRAEDQLDSVEASVRDECWTEMETRMAEERRRWVNAWGEETDRNEEHLDRKIDLLSRGGIADSSSKGVNVMRIHADDEDTEEYVIRLEDENEELRRRLQALEREIHCHSPTASAALRMRTPTKTSVIAPPRQQQQQQQQQQGRPPKLPSLGLGDSLNADMNSGLMHEEKEEEGESGLNDALSDYQRPYRHPLQDSIDATSPSSFMNTLNGLSLSPSVSSPIITTASMDGVSQWSPTPKTPHLTSAKNKSLTANGTGTGGKKMRKLTARKWDLMDENELDEYGVF